MKKIQLLISSTLMALSLLVAPVVLTPATAGAACAAGSSPKDCINEGANKTTSAAGRQTNLGDQLQTIVNILLFVLGAIAVIMIVIGGIKYTTSNGDASALTSAKNTILYSVVGLVIALLAYAIVNFVLDQFV